MKDDTAIHLFKEQLENEGKKLESHHDLKKRGELLTWWYFKAIKLYKEDKIDEIICDGGGDLGIDAIDIDDDDYVHFYQFKNPVSIDDGIDGGDIDKFLEGLNLIIARKHEKIANPDLRSRIEDIYQIVPLGYHLHLVVSGKGGVSPESIEKLNSFTSRFSHARNNFMDWHCEEINWLWDAFYTKQLPTVKGPIQLIIEETPYPVKSSEHLSYIFHLNGIKLAELYNKFGEQLMQQNIRVYGGKTPTNKSIEATCTGLDSANFFYYNNGITFLCNSISTYDPFTKSLTLHEAQVVNGGQTIRILGNAHKEGKLKHDVSILARAISSSGDKEFINNVAVNLNNQTRVEPSFLKSNDPRIIQLYNSLSSIGWYLERREDEFDQLSPDEIDRLEKKIGSSPLIDKVIPLKEGAQSYVATFLQLPELAKKDVKKIFLDYHDGGSFERVFDDRITAEKFVLGYRIHLTTEKFVSEFNKLKRRKNRISDWEAKYTEMLGDKIVKNYLDSIDQVIPQSSIFLCALIFRKHIQLLGESPDELLRVLESDFKIHTSIVIELIQFAKENPNEANKSWPNLLKSQRFFEEVMSRIERFTKEEMAAS